MPDHTAPAETFPVGTRVVKESGDYVFTGTIVAAFTKRHGAPRYVVENNDGVLMIMAPFQLRRFDDQLKPRIDKPSTLHQKHREYTGSLRKR
jgi:hypothetical protein